MPAVPTQYKNKRTTGTHYKTTCISPRIITNLLGVKVVIQYVRQIQAVSFKSANQYTRWLQIIVFEQVLQEAVAV